MATIRIDPFLRFVRQADPDYDKDKRVEPTYKFCGGKKVFVAVTNTSGVYAP